MHSVELSLCVAQLSSHRVCTVACCMGVGVCVPTESQGLLGSGPDVQEQCWQPAQVGSSLQKGYAKYSGPDGLQAASCAMPKPQALRARL